MSRFWSRCDVKARRCPTRPIYTSSMIFPSPWPLARGRVARSPSPTISRRLERICASCYGTKDELSRALALIGHNQRSGAVLDAVTAWFAAGLGLFPILEDRLGPLAIPRSEFGRIQEMVARLGSVPDGETMTLTYQGGQYIQRVITPEVQALRREEFQSRLRTIGGSVHGRACRDPEWAI